VMEKWGNGGCDGDGDVMLVCDGHEWWCAVAG
jgi:hypothetical protein